MESAKSPSAERIDALIRKLNDKHGPRDAVNELVAIGSPAVPALLEAIHDPARLNCMMTTRFVLRRMAHAAVPTLLEMTKRGDVDAAAALADFEEDGAPAVPALSGMLIDPDPDRVLLAIRVLQGIGPSASSAVPALLPLLKNRDDEIRSRAAGVLGSIGPAAAPALGDLLDMLRHDPDASVRERAAFTVGNIRGDPNASVSALIAAVEDRDPAVRSSAIYALREFGPVAARAVASLMHVLRGTEFSSRIDAAKALGTIGAAAVPRLTEALSDPSADVRASAADALGEARDEAGPAVTALRACLKDADEKVREAAIYALGRIGPSARPAVPDLIAELSDPLPRFRQRSAFALGDIGDAAAPAVPALITLLKDRDADVRATAAGALGSIGPTARSAVPALTAILDSLTDEARPTAEAEDLAERAIRSLGYLGLDARPAVGHLVRIVKTHNGRRNSLYIDAAASLGRIGATAIEESPDVVPAMIEMLNDGEDLTSSAAAIALGRMGPSAHLAVPALVKIIESGDEETAACAAGAILNILIESKRVDPAVLSAMEKAARSPDWTVRCTAAIAAARLTSGPAAGADALSAALRETSGGFSKSLERQQVLQLAAAMGKDDESMRVIVPVLSTALTDEKATMRLAAAKLLGDLGPAVTGATQALQNATKDRDPMVRQAARESLRRIARK